MPMLIDLSDDDFSIEGHLKLEGWWLVLMDESLRLKSKRSYRELRELSTRTTDNINFGCLNRSKNPRMKNWARQFAGSGGSWNVMFNEGIAKAHFLIIDSNLQRTLDLLSEIVRLDGPPKFFNAFHTLEEWKSPEIRQKVSDFMKSRRKQS